MKNFWFAGKKAVTALIIYAIILFLVLYQYPMLGLVDAPSLTGGVPTFVLYIWIVNIFYIVVTATVVVWMFNNADRIQWKKTPEEG